MGSGNIDGFAQGKVTGTGSAISVELGFTPTAVKLVNAGGLVLLDWQSSMGDAAGLKTVQGTPVVISMVTTDGVSVLEQRELDVASPDSVRGFQIGADSDVNASGEIIHWQAFC